MQRYLDEATIEEIRQRNDIVDVIGEYVVLNRRGRNHLGLCPFHQEKTPSFTVTPEKQMFYCFGCGVGGNVINFIMRQKGITFLEAAILLAERAGINLPDRQDGGRRQAAERHEGFYSLVHLAAEYYRQVLTRYRVGRPALAYLKQRGLTEAMIDKFQLGYAPDQWDALLSYLSRRGYTAAELAKVGLARQGREAGSYYDRFRNRVIFPIWDSRGRVTAFGGRVLDQSQPKYLNSPETLLFSKSRTIYGLHLAREAIRRREAALVLEGYLDVVTSHQFGFEHAVASLGTALATAQAQLLARYTKNVVLAYDGDVAGQKATLRGMEVLRQQELAVRVVELPSGVDPDEFLHRYRGEGFQELLDKARPLYEYKLNLLCREPTAATIETRAQILKELLPDLAAMSSLVERQAYLSLTAKQLGFPERAVMEELAQYQGKLQKYGTIQDKKVISRHNTKGKAFPVLSAQDKARQYVLGWLLKRPDLVTSVVDKVGQDLFTQPEQELLKVIQQKPSGHGLDAAALAAATDDTGISQLLARIEIEMAGLNEEVFRDSLNLLQRHKLITQLEALQKNLAELGSEAGAKRETLQRSISRLQAELVVLR